MTLKLRLTLAFLFCSVLSFAQQKISLDSDNKSIVWKVKPQSDINGDSIKIYSSKYNSGGWVNAVVPGAVFTSYVNAGIEKDPNYGDNIYTSPSPRDRQKSRMP